MLAATCRVDGTRQQWFSQDEHWTLVAPRATCSREKVCAGYGVVSATSRQMHQRSMTALYGSDNRSRPKNRDMVVQKTGRVTCGADAARSWPGVVLRDADRAAGGSTPGICRVDVARQNPNAVCRRRECHVSPAGDRHLRAVSASLRRGCRSLREGADNRRLREGIDGGLVAFRRHRSVSGRSAALLRACGSVSGGVIRSVATGFGCLLAP